ncbi:TRAP transporter small permease subunit [Alkalihalobacterium elongatum]|uniref:TRAP transporter small permease subunit n=1 Tax=Alkalihalobacterium elongatum TaxID=2675466 RepID=UPI001C1F93AB|nr:TRAP transporter small permease subunit [Alkalihalobacterium elongatum]
MKVLKKIIKGIDTINLWVGKLGAWSIIILTLLVVFEVISRRVFNSPTIWTYETITMVYGFHFMIVAAYALLHKSIVSVDILYERFSLKAKAILDLITYFIFFFPFVLGVFYVSYGNALFSWSINETSSSLFGAPVYLSKTVIPIAFGLLALQGLSEVLKRIYVLVRGETL